MRLITANWKMNPQTLEEARRLTARVEHASLQHHRTVEIAICVPFLFLTALKHMVHHVRLSAQNVSAHEKGPYTGEISAAQLKHLGIRYVIAGHSERRALGEDDKFINQKLKLLHVHKLHPILCVGYGTTRNMSAARVKTIIAKQLRAALAGLKFSKDELTIAYEPVWAISRGPGTAVAVAPEHAAEIIEFIKNKYPLARVLYGGSVTPDNAASLAGFKVIEGALVGAASLDPVQFWKIIKEFSN